MKTFLLLCILFFNVYSIKAQRTIDIEADLVSVSAQSTLSFYKKVNKDTYQLIKVAPTITSNNKLHLTTTQQNIHHSFPKKDSTTFEISSLPNIKPEDFRDSYFNKIYSKKSNIQLNNSDKDVIDVLESAPNQLFTLSIFEKNNKSQDPIWEKKTTRFFNYFFIRINKRKTILVYINNANPEFTEGFLMATKQKPVLFINKYHTSKFISFKENQLLTKEIPDSILSENSIMNWNSANYSIESGKIKDLISRENLHERKFDTLFHHSNFIVGKKDSVTVFYNKKLQNITPKNLRTFNLPMFGRSPFYQSIQVLADNNVTWLTASGELKDDLKPVYQSICGTGLDYNFVQLKITQDENYFYHNDRKLAKTSTYDEVYLMHGENEYQYGNSPKFGNYLKVRKNGKWGIISFKITAVEPSIPLQITEVLAVDYDAIELVESTYIKLEKEGLIGYFQINEKPKYTSLEKFYNYFARFTLPNGKNGWLTTDGNEYLDE